MRRKDDVSMGEWMARRLKISPRRAGLSDRAALTRAGATGGARARQGRRERDRGAVRRACCRPPPGLNPRECERGSVAAAPLDELPYRLTGQRPESLGADFPRDDEQQHA